jgi:DNA-directed RNA polymerase subunit RPC12/RpoP
LRPMDELRLDGNAAAGALEEVFSFEVTMAEYTCEGCGRTDRIGVEMVYEVRQLDAIIRCPSCDNALIRLAHNRGRSLVDLRGARYLDTGEFSDVERGPYL